MEIICNSSIFKRDYFLAKDSLSNQTFKRDSKGSRATRE